MMLAGIVEAERHGNQHDDNNRQPGYQLNETAQVTIRRNTRVSLSVCSTVLRMIN